MSERASVKTDEELTVQQKIEEEVFKQIFIPRQLDQVHPHPLSIFSNLDCICQGRHLNCHMEFQDREIIEFVNKNYVTISLQLCDDTIEFVPYLLSSKDSASCGNLKVC